jgi:hypothetical protein
MHSSAGKAVSPNERNKEKAELCRASGQHVALMMNRVKSLCKAALLFWREAGSSSFGVHHSSDYPALSTQNQPIMEADRGLILDYYRRAADLANPQWKRQGKSDPLSSSLIPVDQNDISIHQITISGLSV